LAVPRRLARLLAGPCLAAAALLGAAPAAAPAAVPELRWSDCGEGFGCATARVPLDHSRPRGRQVELALIRRPATDRARRIGSLFLNPGGPGASGVDLVRAAGGPDGPLAPLNDRFDLVGWDPRGTGASRPAVDCAVDQERQGPFAQPFTRPEPEQEAAAVERARAYIARCLQRNRGFLPFLSTANTARDLDLLRQAVGDEDLSYLGFSYGTFLGATYASLFPQRHRALVLDGAVDEAWTTRWLEATREQTSAFERGLGRFLTACAADQAACSGFGGADPWTAYDELLERLDAQPVAVPGVPDRPVDGDDARAASVLGLYSKSLWGLLGAGLAQAQAGDGTLLRVLADALYGREDDGSFSPSIDAFVAIAGLDQRSDGGVRTHLRAGRHSWRLFDHFWWNSGYGDLTFGLWPVAPRGVFRGPFQAAADAPTTLVVGTTYDTATPYRWARDLTRDLGNARLLTLRGDGHTAYGGSSACIDAAVEAYLEEGVLPAEGTVCRQELAFSAPAARAAAASRSAASRVRAAERALEEAQLALAGRR